MLLDRLKRLIAEQVVVEEHTITMDTHFEHDLGVDSLDVVELMMAMEEEFSLEELSEEDMAKVETVGDMVRFLQSKVDL